MIWEINGTDSSHIPDEDLSIIRIVRGLVYIETLTIRARASYNSTTLLCVAYGDTIVESNTATLSYQGIIMTIIIILF